MCMCVLLCLCCRQTSSQEVKESIKGKVGRLDETEPEGKSLRWGGAGRLPIYHEFLRSKGLEVMEESRIKEGKGV